MRWRQASDIEAAVFALLALGAAFGINGMAGVALAAILTLLAALALRDRGGWRMSNARSWREEADLRSSDAEVRRMAREIRARLDA